MRSCLGSVFAAVLLLTDLSGQDATPPTVAPAADPTYRIMPDLGSPLGTVLALIGTVVDGPTKG